MISALSLFRRPSASRPPRADWANAGDAELALAARTQDREGREAFVEIVRRHQNAVCAVAFSVAGRIGLTDDIAQETFLKAWKRMATLREPAKLKAWLTRIAHDCAVDTLRREKPHTSLDDEMVSLTQTAESSPDKAAADAEDEQLVWSALAGLPENVRTPLVLFYREGQSVAAVAEALDLSEDAVKQRLSRGRNELREQVTAKIEGVLGRVKPNPLLVVTVASGIGLAAAPEAVASGAVSGKSAGGASSAGTHFLAAAAAVVVCVPLGWKARQPAAPNPPPASAAGSPAGDPLAEFSESALLKEWRRLHELHGSNAAAMPVIHNAIQSLDRDFHRRALGRALLTEWSRLDPAAGADFLRAAKQPEHAKVLLQEWLRQDAQNAAAYLVAHAADTSDLVRSLLAEVAERAPQQLAVIADRIPPPKGTFHPEVAAAFTLWAAKNADAARADAEGMTTSQRNGALIGVAAGWAERDGAAALAWCRNLTKGKLRDEASRAAITGWAKSDPLAALDHMKDVPADYREDYRGAVMRAAVQRDFEAVLRWLPDHGKEMNSSGLWDELADPLMVRFRTDRSALLKWIGEQPNDFRKGLIMALATGTGKSAAGDQVAVWQWLGTLPPDTGDPLHQMRTFFIGRTGPRIQELAFEWMKTLPLDKWESRSWIESFVRGRHSDGEPYSTETLERLAADFPPELRAGFYPALLKEKTGWNETELATWAVRIAEVPEFDRARNAALAAESISVIAPETAAGWALALTGDKERQYALRTAVMKWTQADAASASEWVNELPRGKERDVAAETLVDGITESEPDAAWAWALSISNDPRRQATVQTLLVALHKTDPARARQLGQSPEVGEAVRAWFKRAYLEPPKKESEAEEQ